MNRVTVKETRNTRHHTEYAVLLEGHRQIGFLRFNKAKVVWDAEDCNHNDLRLQGFSSEDQALSAILNHLNTVNRRTWVESDEELAEQFN